MKTPQVPAMPGMTPLGFREPMQRAIETNNYEAMRTLLDLMRQQNVGEALVPGLRELCKQARQTLSALAVTNPRSVDQKTVAERQWQKGKLAPKPQQQCDHGLFSDDANQRELF